MKCPWPPASSGCAKKARRWPRLLEQCSPWCPGSFATKSPSPLKQELAEWLKLHYDEQWSPVRAELAFENSPGRPNAIRPVPPALLPSARASPCAVPSSSLVKHSQGGKLRVIDLKTGMVRAQENFLIGGGETLQPVLYAMAVEDFLGAPVVQSSLEYCTLRGGFNSVTLQRIPQARRKVIEALHQLQNTIEAGHLPAYPQRDGCSRCDFQAVCGPRAEMLSRHKQFGSKATVAADWWRERP